MAWNLPNSSGPYPVACCDILDQPGIESSMFRIYYPTIKFKPDEKICPEWMGQEQRNGIASIIGNGYKGKILSWFLNARRVPMYWRGPLKMPQNISKLPVVLISHGLCLTKNAYSHISYEIASHGFLVAAVDHRDGSSCSSMYMEKDERGEYITKFLEFDKMEMNTPEEKQTRHVQVDRRADDVSKMLDCIEQLNDGTLNNLVLPDFDLKVFKDKIDVKKIAAVGHSFGGATVIAALDNDPRIRVCVGLDPWTYPLAEKSYLAKIEKPILFIIADAGNLCKNDIGRLRRLDADVTGISAQRKMVTLKGVTHYTQCDLTFFPSITCIAKKIGMRGETEPRIANSINLKLMLGFIGKYLDLPCGEEVETIVSENADLVSMGSKIQLTDQELQEAKFPSVNNKAAPQNEVK